MASPDAVEIRRQASNFHPHHQQDSVEYDSGIFSESGALNGINRVSRISEGRTRSGSGVWTPSNKGGSGIFAPFNSARNVPRRLIGKNGRANVIRSRIPSLRTAYLRDIGNTLVNSRWRWTLLCFASSHLITWLLFAWLYMMTTKDEESDAPCFVGIGGFAGYFLFSLETQHTIGYGSRFISHNCPIAIFLMVLQMITSVALCGGMASIVYTKMIRPRSLRITSLFSKTAVISQRDGTMCLMFRVRDESNKHSVQTKIEAYLLENRQDEVFLKALDLDKPGFLIWPLEIVHQITPSSPLWDLSAKDLLTRRFELIVSLEGVSVTAAQSSTIRTSYVSSEILWGHRFKPCVKFDNLRHAYYVDEVDFNTTEEVVTPLCSPKRLKEVANDIAYVQSGTVYSPVPSTIILGSPVSSPRPESSGIGSLREEPILTPPDSNRTTRKLSVIREYKSEEHLKVGEVEVHDPEPLERTKSTLDMASTSNTNLDIEKLLENLQSYLDENLDRRDSCGVPGFCETNF